TTGGADAVEGPDADADGAAVAAGGAGSAFAAGPESEAGSGSGASSTVSRRFVTNWLSNFVLTSAMAPRPNCASGPEMVRSVVTVTCVDSPWPTSCAVTMALARPRPVFSLPFTSRTALCAASSFSTNRAVPPYCATTGPTFTFTVP